MLPLRGQAGTAECEERGEIYTKAYVAATPFDDPGWGCLLHPLFWLKYKALPSLRPWLGAFHHQISWKASSYSGCKGVTTL